jgi:hypothetical protein
MLKLISICLICLVVRSNNTTHNFQGTYTYSSGKARYALSGLLQLHYINESKILFYLEVERASDHNSGALYGKLTLNKKNNYYEYLPVEENGCKLLFSRDKNKISIITTAGDCGFGYGVSADGIYLLKDANNPAFLITRTGKKVYFDKTAPQNFKED